MRINIVSQSDKKKITEQLNEQLGIEKIPGTLIEAGNEKIRVFTGSMTREEIMELNNSIRIELVGVYAIKNETEYRISFDSLFLFEDQFNKNIIELTEEEMKLWMRGNDLQKQVPKGTYIMKWDGLVLGCGKSNGNAIFNYVPKNRRFVK